MQLTIRRNEKILLEEILISEINALKEEIHHTDDYNFKEELKILETLLNKIRMLV